MNTTANKHTPGPWHEDCAPDAQGFVTIRPDDGHGEPELDAEPIATVYEASHAALIAAAPELLEALQEAVACLETRIRGALLNSEPDRIGRMRAAIAKAEGRS